MLFSILVAHYNNYEYFKDFYESAIAQTYQNFEIIIVDDASTDDSLSKIRELTATDRRVKIYENDQNRGVGFTKRRCVELSSGEICGFIDPDDAVTPDALMISINKYREHPEIAATYSQIMLCDNKLVPQNIFSKTRKVRNGNPYFFNINNEISHFFTFKRTAYNKTAGINAELSASVDFDLYLKIYEVGPIIYIPKPLYFYRLHSQGISQDQSKKQKTHANWNKMLLDTCKRRNISKIGTTPINQDSEIAKIIFQRENTLLKRVIRRITAIVS